MLQRKSSNVSDKPKSSKPKRSTSFGKFEAFRHQTSTNRPEENGDAMADSGESGPETCEQAKSGSLGKKMKAISLTLTMRKKIGKKYPKAVGVGEDTERDEEEAEAVHCQSDREHVKANSAESLCSGQSSSSVVTSSSDGSSNRDSLRLEDDTLYTGHFCGKARVHTDFVPSPYDSDSLKLKVGDIIDIISKPPMGIWTGVLNNKVGSFKFIYVDVLEEQEPETPKIRPHRRSRRPRPKTLQELLERLQLEEYASTLLLNGYQTVEDLKELKEKHLVELNVTDPEHRQRLLTAVERLQDTEHDRHIGSEVAPLSPAGSSKTEPGEYPRDSGCYVSSEYSDNGKDDIDSQQELQTPTPDT